MQIKLDLVHPEGHTLVQNQQKLIRIEIILIIFTTLNNEVFYYE